MLPIFPSGECAFQALSCIRSLDLFVHCSFSSSMPSSWVLEGRPRNSSSKLTSLTHFSFHIDGFCVVSIVKGSRNEYFEEGFPSFQFEDLDCHLPPSTSCVTISLSLPTIGAKRCVSSLLQFIRRLASVNAYPDLEELHLQVRLECATTVLLLNTFLAGLGYSMCREAAESRHRPPF